MGAEQTIRVLEIEDFEDVECDDNNLLEHNDLVYEDIVSLVESKEVCIDTSQDNEGTLDDLERHYIKEAGETPPPTHWASREDYLDTDATKQNAQLLLEPEHKILDNTTSSNLEAKNNIEIDDQRTPNKKVESPFIENNLKTLNIDQSPESTKQNLEDSRRDLASKAFNTHLQKLESLELDDEPLTCEITDTKTTLENKTHTNDNEQEIASRIFETDSYKLEVQSLNEPLTCEITETDTRPSKAPRKFFINTHLHTHLSFIF